MITFKNKYDGSLVMSQQTHAQEVTSHFPVARLVTIGHFQSEQSLVVVAQWEEHALSVSLLCSFYDVYYSNDNKLNNCVQTSKKRAPLYGIQGMTNRFQMWLPTGQP